MQCPNCNTSLQGDVRFCVRCGQHVGETTRIAVRSAGATGPLAPPNRIHVPISNVPQPEKRRGCGTAVWVSIAAGTGIVLTLLILFGAIFAEWAMKEADRAGIIIGPSTNKPVSNPAPQSEQAIRSESTPKPTATRAIAPPEVRPPPVVRPTAEVPTPVEPAPTPYEAPTRAPQPNVERFLVFNRELFVDTGSYFAEQLPVQRVGGRLIGQFASSTPVECFITDAYGGRVYYNSGRINGGAINIEVAPLAQLMLTFNNRFSILTSKRVRASLYFVPYDR